SDLSPLSGAVETAPLRNVKASMSAARCAGGPRGTIHGGTMDAERREKLEHDIRRRHAGGDIEGAATVAIRGYGPELFELLAACHRGEEAREAFSMVLEDIWSGIARFAWQCSFRTWAYVVTRH